MVCAALSGRFLRRFGLKTGINFAHFGLESGMVFEETTECMNVFIVSIPVSKERKRNMQIRSEFKFFFCLHCNLCNDNIIAA